MKNLRIYVDKDKHNIYEKLVKRGSENPDDFPFPTMKDLFMVAACLGAKYGAFSEITSQREIFNSDVFDEKIDIPVLSALAFNRFKSLDILKSDRDILDAVQEYANSGISYVQEEIINNPGRPLNNLVNLIL